MVYTPCCCVACWFTTASPPSGWDFAAVKQKTQELFLVKSTHISLDLPVVCAPCFLPLVLPPSVYSPSILSPLSAWHLAAVKQRVGGHCLLVTLSLFPNHTWIHVYPWYTLITVQYVITGHSMAVLCHIGNIVWTVQVTNEVRPGNEATIEGYQFLLWKLSPCTIYI